MAEDAENGNIGQGKSNGMTPSFFGRAIRLEVGGSRLRKPALRVDMSVDCCVQIAWDARGAAEIAQELRDAAEWVEKVAARHLTKTPEQR